MRGRGQNTTVSLRKNAPWSLDDGLPSEWYDIQWWEKHEVGMSLSQTPQHQKYHQEGDTWTHTKLVLGELTQLDAWKELSQRDKDLLWLTTVLHDWGKKDVTELGEDGYYHAPGHARRGATLARKFLWQMGLNPRDREQICNAITLHMHPYHALDQDKNPEHELVMWSLMSNVKHMIMLSQADSLGRTPNRLDWGHELLATFAQDQGIYESPHPFADGYNRWWWLQKQERPVHLNVRAPEVNQGLTMLHGLPGTGKDWWAQNNQDKYDVMISLDDLRAQGHPYTEIAARGRSLLRTYLGQGKRVLWNATTINRRMREPLLGIAKNYDASVHMVHIEATPERLYRQNEKRDRTVAPEVIDHMLDRWEVPSVREYWDSSWVVDDWKP